MSPYVFLVAGEESGDRLGAALISAIRERTEGKAHFSCVGGAHMAAEGVPSLFPLGDLAIVGFSSIPAMLSKILRRIREAADAVIAAKPDVLVIIDSPEFTHRVARRVRERTLAVVRRLSIPVIDVEAAFAAQPGDHALFACRECHYTVAGYRVAAGAILAALPDTAAP